MDSRSVPWLDFMQIADLCEDKHWAILPKVCHPSLSFAQRTLEEGDGREKVKDPYGFKLAEDILSSEVTCGMMEAIHRHTGFNPVAFTPASGTICSALDCLRCPAGADGQGPGERKPSLVGTEGMWNTGMCGGTQEHL